MNKWFFFVVERSGFLKLALRKKHAILIVVLKKQNFIDVFLTMF